jgi:hypothetical protein
MTWDRSAAAPALASVLTAAVTAAGENITVFESPPSTANPPAIIVGRVTEVHFSTIAPGIDDVILPVLIVAAVEGEDTIAGIITLIRNALAPFNNLGNVVKACYPEFERNWRPINVAGADLLQAEVTLSIQM